MRAFWLTFTDGSQACCEGQSADDAKRIAEKVSGKKATDAKSLPYPGTPIIWQFDHPVYGIAPDFCLTPEKCAGCGSCPRNRSCCD